MRLNNKNLGVMKDYIKRKQFLKTELKIIMLKSVLNTKQTNPKIRLIAYFNLIFRFKKRGRISKISNPCLVTGRAKTTFKLFNFSRHYTKQLIETGLVQNTRINVK